MSELDEKIRRSIKILRMGAQDGPVEISYSGGKDSDVILALAKMAGIDARPIYKCTTIDPPGTVALCRAAGAEVIRPEKTFFQLLSEKGFPTMRARFCCQYLKEYKIMDTAVQGIRRSESVKRAARYKEPIICRTYGSKANHVNVILPILDWTDGDVTEFVGAHGIKCHPLYYDEAGRFHAERRLGCLGCPLKSDRGRSDFRKYPKLVRCWLKAGNEWFHRPRKRKTGLESRVKFGNIYNLFVHNVFFDSYDAFDSTQNGLFGKSDCKAFLEDYFKIDLTI